MKLDKLATLGLGFGDEARGSQRVFRAALDALSRPGRIIAVEHDAQVPGAAHSASAALMLALLDSDCTLWLSPLLVQSGAAAWLRFHTGCQLVAEPQQAQFVWVAADDAMPALAQLRPGTDEYPDQSATVVLDVRSFDVAGDAESWTLTGPGIAGETTLAADGLAPDFANQWSDNHARFPRGVDVYLAAATDLVGLPRSTRIHVSGRN
jgi:alpha-D-ribose 1-methylphosphonate 5-triphosphate synthase subunit PhnH